MGRILEQAHKDSLAHCEEHTTLKIILADGTPLRFASAEVEVTEDDDIEYLYLGRLEATENLRLSLTISADRIGLKIDNTELELGQALINVPRALDKCFAVLGVYFKNPDTGEIWHDEKLPGEIINSEINGDFIHLNFVSELDAADYGGRNIAEAFPDAQTAPVSPPMLFPYPDLPFLGGRFGDGRHFLPQGLSLD